MTYATGSFIDKNLRQKVSPEEWDTRVNLAAAYRLADHYGMTDMIGNHISARVPGSPNHFLINAYGLLYPEITASNLIKIDLDGNVILKPDIDYGAEYGINMAGFVIHSAVHGARHDVDCIVHTHTPAGMAISTLKCGLLPITQSSTRWAKVAYHDFEGVAINLDERARIVLDLGDAEIMILRNHGLLAVGRSIPEAFNNIYRLELVCRTQVIAMGCNSEFVHPPKSVIELTNSQWGRRRYGQLEWPALLRMMDRKDPSFRN